MSFADDYLRLGRVEFEFRCIATCFDHPAPASAGEPICAAYAGVDLDSTPVLCGLGLGHPKSVRHVYENGGHACWTEDERGRPWSAMIRDFQLGFNDRMAPGRRGDAG